MKILLLIDNLSSGGAQRQIINLAYGLKKNGHKVILVTYNNEFHFLSFVKKYEIEHHHLELKNKFLFPVFIYKLLLIIKKENISVICAYLFSPSIIALLIKVFKSKLKVYVSERSHQQLDNSITAKIVRKLYFLADGIIANSEEKYVFLKLRFPEIKSRIHKISNGINLDLFPIQQVNKKSKNKKLVIIGIGTITSNKNIKLLIESAKLLKYIHKIDFNIIWVGRDYDISGLQNEYAKECYSLIKEYGLEDNWQWKGKQLDVSPYILTSDVLIHTSHYEGFPNVIVEALACGCPVISNNSLDNKLIISEGYNGYIFNTNQCNSLIDKLLKLKQLSPEEYLIISQNARTTALEKFDLQVMTDKYIKLFNYY